MSDLKNILLLIVLSFTTITVAYPVKINQPTAVTNPPNLSAEQIDYYLKNYRTYNYPVERFIQQLPTFSINGPPPFDVTKITQSPSSSSPSPSSSSSSSSSSSIAPSVTIKPSLPMMRSTLKRATTPTINKNNPIIGNIGDLQYNTDGSYYFLPTIRPYPKQTEGYDFYFPQPTDSDYVDYSDKASGNLREFQPPPKTSLNDEPNYYSIKPKKIPSKKYNPQIKQVNILKTTQQQQHQQLKPNKKNQQLIIVEEPSVITDDYQFEDQYYDSESGSVGVGGSQQKPQEEQQQESAASYNEYVTRRPERLTPKSAIRTLRQDELNTGEYIPSLLTSSSMVDDMSNGNKNNNNRRGGGHGNTGDRVEFQMHGFNGPNSYKFGYDTGKGENRQFRVEQRDKDGNVEGQYGYVDHRGKMNLVKYTAKLNEGFKSEKIEV